MTAIDRNAVLIGMTLVALCAIAAAFSGSPSPDTTTAVIVLFGEFVVYFIALMMMNKKATLGMAAGGSLALVITRALCSITGGMLFGVFSTNTNINIAGAWLDFVPAVIQIVLLIIAGPYILSETIPDLIGVQAADGLRGETANEPKQQGPLDASPTGGFIQLFSFEELAALIKKSHGIEGFIIHSHEGLVVWRDLPVRLDIEVLTAKLVGCNNSLGQVLQDSGLTKVRRLMVETREHFVFTTSLNQYFGVILVFNGHVAPEDIMARIAVMSKTAREFLQWKYPTLSMSSGLSKDRVSLEAV
ncbi:hypothetical protein BH09SUM1_BH09SUM1_03850 [soil metagenome]